MSPTIRVQPAARLRREFAVWATEQRPKVRTVAPNTFAVPADVFKGVPEDLLPGALIDGQRYVPVTEAEEELPLAPAAAVEFLVGVPGRPLPDVPESAYGPDSVPLPPADFAPLEDAPTGDEEEQGDQGGVPEDGDPSDPDTGTGEHTCGDCSRPFKSEHGVVVHRRMMHAEES